ncbi:MAG: DUF4870 domain-containing protein [Phycisphaerales bacterium]|nr:DUF4870 domain-containing protein [Phycisphaerales bacterium]
MRTAILLCLLGLILAFGSCVPAGIGVLRNLDPAVFAEVPVEPGIAITHEVTGLTAARPTQICVEMKIHTTSVQEQTDDFGDRGYQGRYAFHYVYRARDRSGGELDAGQGELRWDDGNGTQRDARVDARGGALTRRHDLARFEAPPDGVASVELMLEPDTEYGAEVEHAKLLFIDDAPGALGYVLAWAGMLLAGLPVLVIGVVLLLARASPPATPGTVVTDERARNLAMACHLSALAGFVVPFGNVVAPLVIWLTQRNLHPLVDDQGRESVNFELTMLVYGLVSLLLVLVLIGFVLLMVLCVAQIVLVIIAALRAQTGERYRYPLTIRFLRG